MWRARRRWGNSWTSMGSFTMMDSTGSDFIRLPVRVSAVIQRRFLPPASTSHSALSSPHFPCASLPPSTPPSSALHSCPLPSCFLTPNRRWRGGARTPAETPSLRPTWVARGRVRVPVLPSLPPPSFSPSPSSLPFPTRVCADWHAWPPPLLRARADYTHSRQSIHPSFFCPSQSLLPALPLTSLPLRFTPSPPLVLLPVLLVANAGAFLCAHTLILVY
ncbi:hypothetical protein B0H16DRAFT_1599254 [Mycena metata]|uniref:Uncharacterized protein n=1 Tax=Mycena metata TaxID=1033252 RepID=A0AAD7HLQ9_9AGAR|nr:hypothetical protein B0H16DRAFT_1599254 [Mycena metata]